MLSPALRFALAASLVALAGPVSCGPQEAPIDQPSDAHAPTSASPAATEADTADTFVLVDPRASFFVRPDETGPAHRFLRKRGADAQADRGAVTFRLLGWHDSQWAHVQSIDESTVAQAHCHDTFSLFRGMAVALYVRRDDLFPVVRRPVQRRYADGSVVHLRAGIRVRESEAGKHTVTQGELSLEVDLPADDIALQYSASPRFASRQPAGVLHANAPYAYGDGHHIEAPQCGTRAFHSVRVEGTAGWVTTTERCAEVVVRTTLPGVAPKPAPTPETPPPPHSRDRVAAMAHNFSPAVAHQAECALLQASRHTEYGVATGKFGYLLGSPPQPRPTPTTIAAGTTVALRDGTPLGRVAQELREVVQTPQRCSERTFAGQAICYPRDTTTP